MLAEGEQVTAARTKQHEEEKHAEMGRRKRRKEGSKEKKAKKILPKASIVTKLPVSATKPSR